jgi:poly-beta-1,6-N-acetyl-D-glucosamine synthase
MTILLILLLFLFAFPFLLYPPLLMFLARRFRRDAARPVQEPANPSVALLICALNEQNVICRKMENSLRLDYPSGKLRIIVISDGSTDTTPSVVRGFVSRGVELIEQPIRRGKIQNLNEIVPTLSEDLVVLSDANVMYDSQVIRHLVHRFDDPSVGCVSGKVILTGTTLPLDGGTGQYYSHEWSLQENESNFFSMVGADGAMYAFRRHLFSPCPPDTIIEDFVVPISVIRQQKRVVFEPKAIGWEQGTANMTEEFGRKTRIAAGAVQSLIRGNGWPAICNWRIWFVFTSHKLLRWISPVTGALVLALSMLTPGSAVSRLVLFGFLCLAISAVIRLAATRSNKVLDAPFYFLFGQIAVAIGLMKGIAGKQTVLWSKVNR